jgi:uncharacterized RDD family membrane protein YckC
VVEVVTGEAVVLAVPCARFPSRLAALAIDLAIQWILLVVMASIIGLTSATGGFDPAAGAAVTVTILVMVMVGYPVIWETATRGRSPGKFALGLRVVSDDGSPERFRQALVRGLAAVVEIWFLFGCPALICSLLSHKGKRLGDVFAGTFVIQQRLPARPTVVTPAWMPPALAAWAGGLELSGLTDQTAAMARGYLGRLAELTPSAQAELGRRIAAAVSTQVSPLPPPGTPVPAYLGAVLAERSRREHARLMRPGAPAGPVTAAPANQAAVAPPWGPPAGPAPWAPPAASSPWAPPAPAAPPSAQPGTASKDAAGEQEESMAADPPAPAAGGFVPPQ